MSVLLFTWWDVCLQLQEVPGTLPTLRPASPFSYPAPPLPSPNPDRSLAPPTCVGADVALEQPGPGEGLAAHLTDAGQRVGADMHLEGTQAGILLVTVPTGEGALCRQMAVELLVPGQASQRMIRPVAADALKTPRDSARPLSPEMFV